MAWRKGSGTRTKSEARGLEHAECSAATRYETTLRRQNASKPRGQSRPPAPFGQRRGCRLPQPRGLDRALFLKLAPRLDQRAPHLLITGASGLGKSWLAARSARRLPAGYIRPLLPRAEAVHRSRDRAWRWRLRQAPAHDLARKTAHPRRLGPKRSTPIRREICSKSSRTATTPALPDHQPDPVRTLARYDRHPDTRDAILDR